MDLSATQVYEDEEFPLTQKISHALKKEESVKVGILSIDSTDYQIKTGTTKIGRHSSSDIVINDATVSKLHAEIEASDQGSTWICDLNSSNKTKLNNLILRPTRLYELKNGSTIEFGRVRATYHTFLVSLCHQMDTVIPETPVPSRQKVANTIIPNTPDSLSNSSSADDDGSIILGTQKAEDNVFRQPQVLQQRQSTSIGKKNVSMNERNDSQIAIMSTSDTNTSENQVSIFDAETQKFEKEYKMASKSIHDIETQGDISECLVEANTKADKQLSKLNIHDKTAGRSVDIYDIETQSLDDINEMETQKNKIDIQDITEKEFTDIHTDNNISKDREKNLVQMRRDIHDLETQKFDEYIAEDTSETQLELGSIERCEQGRDISDMETQFVVDSTANKTSNDRDKDKDNTANTTKDKINENVTKLSRSRSSSPESLNLSSPGVEDCPSPLNQSGHLLESTCLSEFFGEGIDKQENMQASTPEPTKVPEKNSNGNLQNEENNDEDIFEAPTQRINYNVEALMSDDSEVNKKDNALAMCKVVKTKRGKSRSERTNSGSETDAEEYVAEKQCESSKILSELPNKDISNRNDPGTSVESEDMFDVPTQRLDNPATKDTTNSSINQSQKVNEINKAVDDTESTQIINNVDQNNRTNMSDINDVGETTSKDIATKNNQNDDMHINAKSVDCTTNFERENIDREPTVQVISEIEDKEKKNSTDERNSSQVNLIDTLEQKLNEMFDNVNNDTSNIEPPHMSTQCLEDVLESSQSDDSINKSTIGKKDTNSVSQKQLRKKSHERNQHSHDLPDTKVNTSDVNMVNSEFEENVTPCQNINSSSADNERAVNNNTAVEFNKKTKKISKTKNKSDAIMEPSNDDNRDKTASNWSNKRNLRNSKSRQKNETVLETRKQGRNSAKLNVDDAEENTICKPCPSAGGQCVQTLDTLYEINDDILMRLPAVRISGTLSNPVSPSASSTSSMRSTRSKQDIAKNKGKKHTSLKKSLHEQGVENSEKKDKLFVNSRSNSVLDTPTTVKISDLVDTSEDSETDSEIVYKRFQQIADRMLGNELSCLKRQDKGDKKKMRVLTNVSEDPERSTEIESKSLARTSLRITRHSSRRSDESSRNLQRETHVKNTDKSTESKTKSIVAKRKNMAEESVEQITSKKCKATRVTEECPVSTHNRRNSMKITTIRHSPNSLEFTKPSSRESSPIIENRKSAEANKAVSALKETQKTFLNTETDRNIDFGRSNIKRTRQIIYDRQVTIHVSDVTVNGNSKKNQSAQTKGKEMQASQSQNKILRVLLSPIKSLADEGSQEVERIMATGLSNAQDKNLSIRESNKAKIFQRELRTRRRKRSQNSDTETDSISIENSMSETGDSDNTQVDNPTLRTKRRRSTKNFLLPEIQVSKKEAFKKPRIKNSINFNLDSSAENTIGESSQGSTDSNASTSSRVSRSKVTNIRKKEKELNQDRLIDESASELTTSGEITYLSTPSRMRRSTSILNNFTPSAMRHKVLFTGITEDYSKVVKTLGGSKIEDPAKCTILVTDKVRRTYKFLCALAKGIPIVAIDWLKDSEAAARFLDWENYILKDPVAEAKFGFKLRKSFAKAKEKRLLDGYVVVLTPNVAPPPTEELKDMVSSCGGKALLRPPTKWPEKAIVLSREEDLLNARKFLIKAPKTVTIQSTEFILTGILKQETDFKKYKLMC